MESGESSESKSLNAEVGETRPGEMESVGDSASWTDRYPPDGGDMVNGGEMGRWVACMRGMAISSAGMVSRAVATYLRGTAGSGSVDARCRAPLCATTG